MIDEDYIQNDGLIAENEHLHLIVTEQTKEIERLHSIIKEAREYIEDNLCWGELSISELVEILDKVEEKVI